MKFLTFKSSSLLHILFAFCCILQFSSCGQDDTIDYRERLIGEWELKNVGELQTFFRNRPFMLKSATMRTGEYLTIKSDNSPFNDVLDIYFTDANERMFSIILNELEYQFVKK